MAVTVAVDGRGVERGPDVLVQGLRTALDDGIAIRLFGDPEAFGDLDGIEMVEALDHI